MSDKMREAFDAYLKECDDNATVPNTSGAFVYAWQAAISQPAAVEGWHQDGGLLYVLQNGINHYEVNVTMAGGSRDTKARSDFAHYLLSKVLHSAPVQQSVPPGLIEALRDYQFQIDEDGTNIGVNRQAVYEAVQILTALSTSPLLDKNDQAEGELRSELWKMAEWLDNSANLAQSDFDSPPEPQSQFDYELTQAATRLRELSSWLPAPQPDSNELVELRRVLKPFALASIEGVVTKESGYVTITTCAEYFHRAAAALTQSPSVGLNTKKGG